MQKRNSAVVLVLLLIGVAVLLYPAISDYVNHLNGSYAIEQMHKELVYADVEVQRKLAQDYNARLPEGKADGYEEILNLANGIMGSIRIPKIDVNLPIYHGTDEEVLTKGVGHLPNSAFPIGGEGNHAVLTGHTGLPSAKLFTDLTELKEGDTFQISILNETLSYEVDQIKVVLPSEGQDLAAVPGEDLCTLVTCTPYGINSHRLLVRGRRYFPEEEPIPVFSQTDQENSAWFLLFTTGLILLIPVLIIHRKRRKER